MIPIETARSLPATKLELFFDYTCPYAYLASTQARSVAAQMGVELTYRPILLGGVFRAVGTPQDHMAKLGAAKAAHNLADMQRWAKRFGVTLRVPSAHPMRSVEALRATLATGIDPRVVDAFYRAYWVDGREISRADVIRDVLRSAGREADADRVLTRIDEPAIKDDLRTRTEEAVSRGVFGVPTWIVDDAHLYWGQDRIPFVIGTRGARPAVGGAVGGGGGGSRAPGETPSPAALPHAPRTIEFYWDFSSPFAYLASTQAAALAARTGAVVVSRPILLGGLFRAIGTAEVPLATFSEAKQRHVAKDLDRWAAYWMKPFRFPSRFPTHSVKALRVWYALAEERRDAYRDAVFRAYWAEDRDITDDAVLASCVGDEGAAREALAKSGADDVKAALRAATAEAAARGVFGVPTFVVGGELYWGQDRLDLVEEAASA
jgi:2-hydroxychromene-2-carboxylate isomerase